MKLRTRESNAHFPFRVWGLPPQQISQAISYVMNYVTRKLYNSSMTRPTNYLVHQPIDEIIDEHVA